VEKTARFLRHFLKGILIFVIVIVIIIGSYFAIGSYWAWHQEQYAQNIISSLKNNNPTPNPIIQQTPTIPPQSTMPNLATPTLIPTPTPNPTVSLTMSNQTVFTNQPFNITITVTNYNLPCQYNIVLSQDNSFSDGYILNYGDMTTSTITIQTVISDTFGNCLFDASNTQAFLIVSVNQGNLFNSHSLQQATSILMNPTS